MAWMAGVSLAVAVAAAAAQSGPHPPTFAGRKVGTVENGAIAEASGIVASRKNPGVFWVHNDSGDTARVFAMTSTGKHLGIYTFWSTKPIDCEDIAIGPGPSPREHYLYVGDVGDNRRERTHVTIYRFPEPSVSTSQAPSTVSLRGAVALKVKYPNPPVRAGIDCETVMVDPANGDLYLVTKDGANGKVYRYPVPHDPNVTATLEYVGPAATPAAATGGEISPTGREIVVRTGSDAWTWPRSPGQSIRDAFGNPPRKTGLIPEPQGEAICFSHDGNDLYTISERPNSPIYHYPRTSPPPPEAPQ